jgi:hypothetical protein
MADPETFTAFVGHQMVATGPVETVAEALVTRGDLDSLPLIFDNATGKPVELDLRHGAQSAIAEYRARNGQPRPVRQGRGRPRLGVIPREVTLLPRHWDWLASQPGGASAALRRLVDDARRSTAGPDRARQAQETAYRVMSALAGDLPRFEEASRALFAGDREKLAAQMAQWPPDVRAFVSRLAAGV